MRSGKPILQLKMCDRDAVARFAAAVQTPDRVLGPYKNRSGETDGYQRRDFYVWTVDTTTSQLVLDLLWPWLTETRRSRAREVGFFTDDL